MTPKYSIGETVFCIGSNAQATVIGMFPGNHAANIAQHTNEALETLDKRYPGWRDKYCYMLDYGKEMPLMSKYEFERRSPEACGFLESYQLVDIVSQYFLQVEDAIEHVLDLSTI